MLFAISFFIELFLLFILSKQLTMIVSRFFFHLTRKRTVTVYLMALLFFPGTVLHEMSHFLMANLLFVPTGEIDLLPKAEEDTIKLGSVAISRTDPFRRLLIGMAPFLFGTSILLALLFYAVKNNWFSNTLLLLCIIYALFEIGNTMFSSRKDMEGTLELFAVVTILSVALYIIGVRLPMINVQLFFANPTTMEVFQKGSLYLLAPLAIDIVVIGLLKLLKH